MFTDYQLLTIFISIVWLILNMMAYDEMDMILCMLQFVLGFFVFMEFIDMSLMHEFGLYYYVFPITILFWSLAVLVYGIADFRRKPKQN